ncbi:DNA replication initiation control protein YabA [Lacticaseibacillus zhaodongensis]|uniref:DNA replication initiation control protein YabA n=1 Tax=Lacticaseibacillus zhaodongensis TaxID=2668065 RepID=UPI0012D33105|nr:DNA replication initiation control protein YabA [Lacticaseibacillus zhaodongensis]
MAKTDVFGEFMNVSKQAADHAAKLAQLKDDVTAIMEQNAELRMENQHLRERVEELTNRDNAKAAELRGAGGMTKSKQNLEKIYGEGYHVCSKFYGQHLEAGESCAFCLDILYGDR